MAIKFDSSKIPGYGRLSPKHRKIANLAIGGVAAVVVVSAASSLLDGGPTTGPASDWQKPDTVSAVAAPGGDVNPQQFWMATQEKRMNKIDEWMKSQQAKSAAAAAAPAAASAPTAVASAAALAAVASTPQATPAPVKTADNSGKAGPNPPADAAYPAGAMNPGGNSYPRQPGGPTRGGAPVNPNAPGAHLGLSSYPPGAPNGSSPEPAEPSDSRVGSRLISMSVAGNDDDKASGDADGEKKPKAVTSVVRRVDQNFIPIGFMRGRLLGGLDAATGGQSQSDPIPVLIHVKDNGFLPNGFRSKVRNCFVIAHGNGDISSERAYLRTVTLSCVLKDGRAVETAIRGSVFGEDGKNGLRGKVITKQGQILANALIAGIAGGIGSAFSQQGQTVAVSPLGTTTQQSQDAKTVLQNGLGKGAGDALNRLSAYYISIADKMFPVIEIDAGRDVDIVLTQGVQVDAMLSDDTDDAGGQGLPQRSVDRSSSIDKLIGSK